MKKNKIGICLKVNKLSYIYLCVWVIHKEGFILLAYLNLTYASSVAGDCVVHFVLGLVVCNGRK